MGLFCRFLFLNLCRNLRNEKQKGVCTNNTIHGLKRCFLQFAISEQLFMLSFWRGGNWAGCSRCYWEELTISKYFCVFIGSFRGEKTLIILFRFLGATWSNDLKLKHPFFQLSTKYNDCYVFTSIIFTC